MNDVETRLLDNLYELPVFKTMFAKAERGDDISQQLYVAIPTAFISQFLVIINHLSVLNNINLDSEQSYRAAIWDFGADGNREVYSSVILRSWVIINRILNPNYIIPQTFRDNIANKTFAHIIDKMEYNYFIEPLLFDIPIIEKIIKYYNIPTKTPNDDDNILKDLVVYFISNELSIIETWKIYMNQRDNPKNFNSDYSINSYIKLLTPTSYFTSAREKEKQQSILKGSLLMDTLILKKIHADIQMRLDASQNPAPAEKASQLADAAKLIKLTENMSTVLRKYYLNIHGGKKTRKMKYKIVRRKLIQQTRKQQTRKQQTRKQQTKKYKKNKKNKKTRKM